VSVIRESLFGMTDVEDARGLTGLALPPGYGSVNPSSLSAAVVIVGAQAVYLQTGDAGLSVAPFTRDGDVALDPGPLLAANPAVTPSTFRDTICKSGWTSTVRPPTSIANAMKVQSARSYGIPAVEKGGYDHLVSFERVGAVDDSRSGLSGGTSVVLTRP